MNKRERKAADAKAKAEAPVTNEVLEHWANYPVGGSGMGVSTQQMIKNMAVEILKSRDYIKNETDNMEIYETDRLTFSDVCCKIQMRYRSGVWEQRHIWYPPTLAVIEESIGPWIRSVQIPPGNQYHLVNQGEDE